MTDGFLEKEVWVVKGVGCDENGAELPGSVEWQFSDGPAGNRDYSEDYRSLEEGLRAHSGKVMHWDPQNDGPGDF